MTATIDRFEGEFAIIEFSNELFALLNKCQINYLAKEGDLIFLSGNIWKKSTHDINDQKSHIKSLIDELFI